MSQRIYAGITIALCLVDAAEVAAEMEAAACYGSQDVAGAVIGTFIATLALLAAAMFIYKWYWRSRKGKHLVLTTDAENPNDQYAFDNPCFREATPVKHAIQDEKTTSKLDKNKWLGWSPLHSFGVQKSEKLTSLDDSYVNDSHLKVVSLKGHDFTGLGFNICGNMRDGIFVKDVLHRGPAFESGCINSGDRIDSVCISFRNMVFEDALTILSYASPYEVQVQVENDSHSRPSTLIRSKRESNAVSSAERIRHPKYNRSQSISHLAEIGKSNNKWYNQQPTGYASEKNRINQSLNKSDLSGGSQNDYPTLKISAVNDPKKETNKLVKNAISKSSPKNIKTVANTGDKKASDVNSKDVAKSPDQSENDESKMQKFGIKVLPISINPKMGIQSVTGAKKAKNNSLEDERLALQKSADHGTFKSEESLIKPDEVDGNKDNVKTLITKGLHNLKEKINQNSLGRKKSKDPNEEGASPKEGKSQNSIIESSNSRQSPVIEEDKTNNVPIPKVRSSVPTGTISTEQIASGVPEEVTRAGDVARSNRKSLIEPHESSAKKVPDIENDVKIMQQRDEQQKIEEQSGSDSSSESGYPNALDEAKRPKRSKGKAPAPPQPAGKDGKAMKSADMNAITNESDIVRDEKNIFEPTETETMSQRADGIMTNDRNFIETYDSDSDADIRDHPLSDKRNGTKIELSATQVTIHHSPTSDTGNDEEIETSRKAASLGDLSKLDSDHTLTVVLERAVSLDLADGTSQCGKKRKAPLPPPEEFPAVFDEIGYRKEPRLENSLGLNTFQRRLKKSSDFGTLEDALQDGPKSLEFEIKKHNPSLDVLEANHSNIQEFSSWLAECRKQKDKEDDSPVKATSKSLVNVNMSDTEEDNDDNSANEYAVQTSNVTFSVNGKNLKDFENDENVPQESSSANNYTVLVISQPNSLEPIISEGVSMNVTGDNSETPATEQEISPPTLEKINLASPAEAESHLKNDEIPPKLPTSPIPVISKTTLSSPLSKSLTYVTEIKVSTSDEEGLVNEPPQQDHEENVSLNISASDDGETKTDVVTEVVSASPTSKSVDVGVRTTTGGNSISELVNKYSKRNQNEEITVNNESVVYESPKRGNDYGYETSRIPIRTMKSETGQKVLATIQSLAAKESPPKTPEVEYAKRVASLFSSPGSNTKSVTSRQAKFENESSGFYLNTSSPKKPAPNRKIPPTVPPRKVDTSLASGKSTVTVALSGKPTTPSKDKVISTDSSDRNIITFSSFMPRTTNNEHENLPKIVNWKENSKEIGDINGGHVQIESGVVHLPVKTSATKIVFENKDMDKEEL